MFAVELCGGCRGCEVDVSADKGFIDLCGACLH